MSRWLFIYNYVLKKLLFTVYYFMNSVQTQNKREENKIEFYVMIIT